LSLNDFRIILAVMSPIKERPSPNHDARAPGARVDMLVFHYTGMETPEAAFACLCDAQAKVSAHYVIEENGDVTRLVEENRRAWHAGETSWLRQTDINSCSIGIELINPGHQFGYRAFPEAQMAATETLAGRIVSRYGIRPQRVLGHSDVAPIRKSDPGELFDWRRLAAKGIGLWPGEIGKADWAALKLGDSGAGVARLQEDLFTLGYNVEVSGSYGAPTTVVVSAFQRHFRQAQVDGIADRETRAVLAAVRAAARHGTDLRA
jgi:N-acetylmuramoyl-L-alanine amidase